MPTITNCVVAGNRKTGVDRYGDGASVMTNCTVVGNGLSGIECSDTTVTNCIVWGNSFAQIVAQGPATKVTHSDVQGGYTGDGNIDAEPGFVHVGYWSDAVWVEGDYGLLPGSACIDAGDNAGIAPDSGDVDGDGNTTEPIPQDADGKARVIDGDNDGNSVVDMGAYESRPAVEVLMKFTPQSVNPDSQGKWVKAHIVLPEGFGIEDVDLSSPAMLIEPFRAESEHLHVFVNKTGLIEVEAAFDRFAFCSNDFADRTISVVGILSGTSGQYLLGTDAVGIIDKTFEQLAVVASYWLESGCAKPDWCNGVDLDQDGAVDFSDLALFGGCCIEVVSK
jgi:hypothetical protein